MRPDARQGRTGPTAQPVVPVAPVMTSSFETADRDEALDYVRKVYATSFSGVPTPGPFRLAHRRTDYGPWTSDAVQVLNGGFGAEPYGTVSICRLRAGRARLTTGRDTLSLQTGDVFVMADASRAYTATWSAADATILRIPVEELRRVTRRSTVSPGSARLAFLSRRPATAAAGRRMTKVVDFAERHLADGDTPPASALRRATADLLAATILTTFPNTLVADSCYLPSSNDVPATVALALDFIDRNADLPITSSDIAAHASVSRRALEMAFRDHLAISPAAYLRRHRLARIHEELAAAKPGDGTSVTDVAVRWGFTRSSGFASHYRHVFGEPPSRTLRGSRHG